MNKAIRDQWVTNLRSGKYKQGRSYLRNTRDEFCCLGVLCDQLFPADWKKSSEFPELYEIFHSRTVLPPGLRMLIAYDVEDELMSMNDDEDLPFEEIANWIENNIPVEED